MKALLNNRSRLTGGGFLLALLLGQTSLLGAPPEASILAPATGSRYLPGTSLPVQVVATDPDGLIRQVDLFLNDNQVSSTVGGAASSFRTEIQLPSIGTYTLRARVVDNDGEEAFSQDVILEAGPQDETSPRVVIDFPLPLGDGDTVNDVSYASSMFLNAKATDPDGTISDVRFYINGQLLGSAEHSIGDVYSLFYDPNALGDYTIAAEAIDNDGNSSWSVPLALNVGPLERPLPKAEMVQPFPESVLGRVVGLFVEADGGLIPIDRVDFFANGVFLGSADEPVVDNLFSINWVPEEPGDFDLQARVVQIDPAGATLDNWTISEPVPITIVEPGGGNQPTLEILDPVDGENKVVLRPIRVQVDALDPLGSINAVRLYVNGREQEVVDRQFPYVFNYIPQSPGQFQFVAEMLTDRDVRLQSDPVTVTVVQTGPPEGEIILPGGDTPTVGSDVRVVVASSDPDGYVASTTLFVNGEPLSSSFWSPQGAGIYELSALLVDNSANETLVERTVTVGPQTGTSPRITLSVTGAGNVTPGSRVVVRANVFDDDPEDLSVAFLLNGEFIGQDDTAPFSAILDPDAVGLNGSYSMTAVASDRDGNSRADQLFPLYVSDFSVDQPSVSILNLVSGEEVTKGSRVPIRVDVSGGAARDLESVVFYADGVEIGRLPGTEPTGKYTFDWIPDRLGRVEVAVATLLNTRSYDHDDDIETPMIPVTPVNVASPVQVMVNEAIGVLPSISLDVMPKRTGLAIGSKVLLYADAQDLGGAITQVEFFIDGIQVGMDTESPYTYVHTVTQAGDYPLNALVTDSDGNIVTSTIINLNVLDRVVPQTPVATLTVPSSGQEGSIISLRASAQGFINPPNGVSFYANGQIIGSDASVPYSYPWVANLSGPVTFFATADTALDDGSLVTTVSNIVSRDLPENTPPAVTGVELSFPNQSASKVNPLVGEALTFTVDVADTGALSTVELFRDGEVIEETQDSIPPFEFVDTPPSAGIYVYSVLVTDRGGLQAQSEGLSVTVETQVDRPNTLEITSFSSDLDDDQILVGTTISFSGMAEDTKWGVEELALVQGGEVVDTLNGASGSFAFTPMEAGTFTFQLRATNGNNGFLDSDVITINVRYPDPIGVNSDFVYQVFLDLLLRTPTDSELVQFTSRLNTGDLSRDRFVRELIDPADGLSESDYDAVRSALVASRMLLGQWPSRDDVMEATAIVRDTSLKALVVSLMPSFESMYVSDTGAAGVPGILSPDAEIRMFVAYLFGLKYGVEPSPSQSSLGVLHFKAGGRDAFAASLISDAEVVATSSGFTTTGLGFQFPLSSPPSDQWLREADAASLLINLLRIQPSDGEVSELAGKLFAAQVMQVVEDPRYSARFSSVFAEVAHHAKGWRESDWFGWFRTTSDPWVFHAEQGWVMFEMVGQLGSDLWYYDSELGWMWTESNLYPVLFEERSGAWLMSSRYPYIAGSQRWFYDFAIEDWVSR